MLDCCDGRACRSSTAAVVGRATSREAGTSDDAIVDVSCCKYVDVASGRRREDRGQRE